MKCINLKKTNHATKRHKENNPSFELHIQRKARPNRRVGNRTKHSNVNSFNSLLSSKNPHSTDSKELAHVVTNLIESFYVPNATAKESKRNLLLALSRLRSDLL